MHLRSVPLIRPHFYACALAGLVTTAACSGSLRKPDSVATKGQASSAPVAFTCAGESSAVGQPLRRLSRDELAHTLEDLVAAVLPSEFAATVRRELAPVVAALPVDSVSKDAPFSRMDQVVSQQHVDTFVEVAQRTAALLTADDARTAALLACAPKLTPSGCIDNFLRRFGRLAFRHALSDAEFAFLRETYKAKDVDVRALRNLITLVLASPQFLYHAEVVIGPVEGKPGVYTLHATSLAERLAYHLWQTMPDDALLTAAEQGQLDHDEGLRKVVDRMLDDPRAERGMRTFIMEWFGLSTLRPLDGLVGDPVFDAFAGEDLPSPDLRQAMLDEVVDSFVYHVKQGGTYADWLRSPYSFARQDELAALYDVPVWDGESEPPRFAPGTRAGLLTRAALLATGTPNTRPIMKGVFIRKRLLCDDIPPPPPNAANVPPPLSPELTTREVVEALTEQPESACASCHTYQINPLGFATENYDSLGRLREAQRLFSPSGEELGQKPVDTRVVPRIFPFDKTPANGPAELVEKILESGKGEACFARQYLRFSYGRPEDLERDGCVLEAMRVALGKPNGLREAMRVSVLHPSFRQREVDTR